MQPSFMHNIIHDYSSGKRYYTNEALFTLVSLWVLRKFDCAKNLREVIIFCLYLHIKTI